MVKSSAKKIAIIGNAGSGKTTLAFKLQKKLNLPLYHLDQYYWLPNWERSDSFEFIDIHDELCEKSKWIIEGSYIFALNMRAYHADVIIFLDLPRYLCVWRVIKRAVLNLGTEIPGSPKGCKQKIFSYKFFEFLKWIWDFDNRSKKLIKIALDRNKKRNKQIFILSSQKDISEFMHKLQV